jgi:HAD superfamily hydrolase (TIGR01509 family)
LAVVYHSMVAVMVDVAHAIRAVVFDVGETLVDETPAWSSHADTAGLTRLTLFAALGALIERGEDHRHVWELLGVDAPTDVPEIAATDLYPDVIPCLRALAAGGLSIGLAGNQPDRSEPALAALGLPISFTASSARWGVEKPRPEFFERVIAEADVPAHQIAYVGDRLDNDVLPARRAGMFAVFIRRGPWGYLHAHRQDVSQADATIDTLAELPALLGISATKDVQCEGASTGCPSGQRPLRLPL